MVSAPAGLQYDAANCTIAATLRIVGEKWTWIVLREVFNGIRRFDDIKRHTAIPRQVLSDRLTLLVGEGILRKTPYQISGQRARSEYRLTHKGFDLYPVLLALMTWGDRYLADADGPPVTARHRECGARVGLVMRCENGHEVQDAREVAPAPGPGARLHTSVHPVAADA